MQETTGKVKNTLRTKWRSCLVSHDSACASSSLACNRLNYNCQFAYLSPSMMPDP